MADYRGVMAGLPRRALGALRDAMLMEGRVLNPCHRETISGAATTSSSYRTYFVLFSGNLGLK
jgi:hypothetical protein